MKYIDVLWKHEFSWEPVRLISEIDAKGYEVRKLEFFRNGRVGYAEPERSTTGTELGDVPVPPLEEINSDPQFEGVEIAGDEFEELWAIHVEST